MESGPRRPVFSQLLRTLRKRKWFVLFIGAAAAATGGAVALRPPPLYSADALLLLRPATPGSFWQQAAAARPGRTIHPALDTEARLLQTTPVAERAARRLQAQTATARRAGAAEVLRGLSVHPVTPDLLQVTFTSPRADWAAPVVNAVAAAYSEAARKRDEQALQAGEAYLVGRLGQCQQQMTALEQQRLRLLTQAGTADVQSEVARLNALLAAVDRAQVNLQQALREWQAAPGRPAGALPPPAAGDLGAGLAAQVRRVAQLRSDVERLDEALQVQRTGYREVWTKLSEQRYAAALRPQPAEVVEWARGPRLRDGAPLRALALWGALGLLAGVLLAAVAEAADTALRTPDDLALHTGLGVLGVLPRLDGAGEAVVVLAAPRSPAAETYRLLRSNIIFALQDAPRGALLFTSATVGEGKSTVLANLAVAFAQTGQRVLVVESDLRRPHLHRLLGCRHSPGLTEVLGRGIGLAEAVQDTSVPGVQFLACGELPGNPAELLGSRGMAAVLEELRGRADLLLLDSPPALAVADAALLAAQSDHVLIVCETGRTTREAFAEMRRLIEHARGDVLGVVLNKLRVSVREFAARYNAAPQPSNGPPRPTAVPS